MTFLKPLTLGLALAVLPLAITSGCDKKAQSESTESSKDFASKVAEAQQAEGQAQGAALETRVKAEKNNSTAALLQEILDRDKQIGELNTKVARLQAQLPKPQIATEQDNHFAMALRSLKGKGLSEEKA